MHTDKNKLKIESYIKFQIFIIVKNIFILLSSC